MGRTPRSVIASCPKHHAIMSKHVLILDDSELIASMLEMVCGQLGYTTSKALSMAQVAAAISPQTPDIILSDLNLPDAPDPVVGLRQIEALRTTPIILISGTDQGKLDAIAKDKGAQGALSKDSGLPGMMTQLPAIFAQLFKS